MRALLNRYETDIRLGLLIIVVLLMLLNISTTFLFYQAKSRTISEIDENLAAALDFGAAMVGKNQKGILLPEQVEYLKRNFNLLGAHLHSIDSIEVFNKVPSKLNSLDKTFPLIEAEDWKRLWQGEMKFHRGGIARIRYGLAVNHISKGKAILLAFHADSRIVDNIGQASKYAIYPAIAILILIVPLTIILPRVILKPFKQMRKTAEEAGHLKSVSDGDDDVIQIIDSYKKSIKQLKDNEIELKRLYQESSNKAERLERLNQYILKSIASGIINVDLTGKIIGYNRAAGEILGYPDDLVMGKYYLAAFPDEPEVNRIIEAGLERGESICRRELELYRQGNMRIWLGIESSQIFDDQNRAIGVTLLITDLTEVKQLQSELEINRQMAALGEMTAGLAHQLRNSLAAISGFSQLLKKKTKGESSISEIADSIRSESAASEQMVRRFLDFSRPLSISHEYIDFGKLIDDIAEKFMLIGKERNISIVVNLMVGQVRVMGDFLLLKEAISNVIDNSIREINQNGTIEISAEICSGNEAVISITDDGPGIDKKILNKLFTPFVSSRPSGTGLGLALTRKIVNLHDGSIGFDTGYPSGARCEIRLPIMVTADMDNQAFDSCAVKNV
ncbi:MAG: ATP-binding protein [Candidatus Zixiibacteriota bacterium]